MNSFRLAIVSSETSWYFRQLESAALGLGIAVHRLDFSTLAIGLNHVGDKTGIPCDTATRRTQSETNDWNPDFDATLVRTMPLGSLEQVIFRMDVLRSIHATGTPVINSPTCLETSIDKLLTLELFRQNQIPFPETFACQSTDQALDAFEHLDQDVVIKPIFGGEGRGIIRVCEPEVAYRIFKSLEYSRSVIYCQRFIANVEKEFRVLFVADKFFAMKRTGSEATGSQSWIRNAAQGGTAQPYEPDPNEIELARKAAEAVDGTIVGVDILLDREGQYHVLEVNAVPGWKLLERVTETDIATEIVTSIVDAKS